MIDVAIVHMFAAVLGLVLLLIVVVVLNQALAIRQDAKTELNKLRANSPTSVKVPLESNASPAVARGESRRASGTHRVSVS